MPVMTCARILPAVLALALAACAPSPQAPADALSAPLPLEQPGAVIARVDGIEIRQAWLDALAQARGLDLNDAEQRGRAIDELIEYALLSAAARRAGAFDTPARAEVELNALAGRANAVLARMSASEEPAEALLRQEYDQQARINGDTEYKVSHLLFADQALAAEASAQLHGQAEYAGVQASFRDRAQQTGELGWIKLGQVPEPFAAALRELVPGQSTAEPVQTSYGWHVIHLHQTRPFQAPAYEHVREGIRRMLIARSTRATVDALKAQARIEIVDTGD